MVDVEQVAVEVQMLVFAHLNGSIGRLVGQGARREVQFDEQAKGRHGHFGQALGHEVGTADDDVLDVRVGGLLPGGLEGGHCESVWVLVAMKTEKNVL